MNHSDFMRGAVDALGWAASEVVLWPVRASDVFAYRSAGFQGSNAKGVMDIRRFVSEQGDVGVAVHQVSFKTDAATAETVAVRRAALEYDGRLYDVIGMGPIRPGDVDIYLQEYIE
jgi:hypothetical protein